MRPKLDPTDPDTARRLNMFAPKALMKRIDDWRRQQPDLPNVSEAVRRLVELGLEGAKKGGRQSR